MTKKETKKDVEVIVTEIKDGAKEMASFMPDLDKMHETSIKLFETLKIYGDAMANYYSFLDPYQFYNDVIIKDYETTGFTPIEKNAEEQSYQHFFRWDNKKDSDALAGVTISTYNFKTNSKKEIILMAHDLMNVIKDEEVLRPSYLQNKPGDDTYQTVKSLLNEGWKLVVADDLAGTNVEAFFVSNGTKPLNIIITKDEKRIDTIVKRIARVHINNDKKATLREIEEIALLPNEFEALVEKLQKELEKKEEN